MESLRYTLERDGCTIEIVSSETQVGVVEISVWVKPHDGSIAAHTDLTIVPINKVCYAVVDLIVPTSLPAEGWLQPKIAAFALDMDEAQVVEGIIETILDIRRKAVAAGVKPKRQPRTSPVMRKFT